MEAAQHIYSPTETRIPAGVCSADHAPRCASPISATRTRGARLDGPANPNRDRTLTESDYI